MSLTSRAKTVSVVLALLRNVRSVASSAKRKRFQRRDIRGTEGVWEVNAAGNVYKYDRLQPIGESVAGPTINFGHCYINETLVVPASLGPVPAAGRRTDTGGLLAE